MGRFFKTVFFLLFWLVLISGGLLAYEAHRFLTTPASATPEEIVINIAPGATFDRVAWDLKKAGAITDVTRFRILAYAKDSLGKVRAGEYMVNTGWTPEQVLKQITEGRAMLYRLSIREGLTWWETARAVEQQGFATYDDFKAVIYDPEFLKEHSIPFANAEGFLYPETYLMKKPRSPLDREQAREVASTMVRMFWKKTEPIWTEMPLAPGVTLDEEDKTPAGSGNAAAPAGVVSTVNGVSVPPTAPGGTSAGTVATTSAQPDASATESATATASTGQPATANDPATTAIASGASAVPIKTDGTPDTPAVGAQPGTEEVPANSAASANEDSATATQSASPSTQASGPSQASAPQNAEPAAPSSGTSTPSASAPTERQSQAGAPQDSGKEQEAGTSIPGTANESAASPQPPIAADAASVDSNGAEPQQTGQVGQTQPPAQQESTAPKPRRPDQVDPKAIKHLIIMASLVEKETGVPSERARVAGVYTNRLRLGMLLQCDPTIIYGIGEKFTGSILRSQINDPANKYNTYQHPGLPPGPICSSGFDALMAAFKPEKHDFLYFVATGLDASHTFSKTLNEHNKAVQVYRARMRAKQ